MKFESRTYEELQLGEVAELRRLITADDLYIFAAASGNFNPMHLPNIDGNGDGQPDNVVPGMMVASLISAVLGTMLPGPGTLYRSQNLRFLARAHVGDELLGRVKVVAKNRAGEVHLETEVLRPSDNQVLLLGEAVVEAPQTKYHMDGLEVPGLVVQRHRHFEALLEKARPLPPLVTVVVCPEEDASLEGALLAARESIITPILVGNAAKINDAANRISHTLDGIEIVDVPSSDAATMACAIVNEGRAGAVMKGHLHTDDLLHPMLDKTKGLRVGRRFTHVFVMDVPGMPYPLLVSDAAINIAPDLITKVDIIQNAIDLALSIGIERPRVGVLSAVETINPAIQSSIDAALLSKMAERGQIKGGGVDGPLAMDNAVNMTAARIKGIKGDVAGQANILVVPGIDAGNMLAKQLAFISNAEGAGVVMGAKVPIILNSRSDSAMSRLASCAVAALHDARMAAETAK
jgi:phosphotransacetylase/acyl dehydratase